MDRFKNLDEMMRYSDHFLAVAPGYVTMEAFVGTLIAEHQGIRDQVAALVTTTRDNRSGLSMSRSDQRSLSDEVAGKLQSVYYTLRGQQGAGTFDFRRFFPNGILGDIGTSITAHKAALQCCIEGFGLYPSAPDAAGWTTTLTELQGRFSPKVDEVSSKDATKRASS